MRTQKPHLDPPGLGPLGSANLAAFEDYEDLHSGSRVVVVGCGPSAHEWTPPPGVITIGLTYANTWVDTDYLLIIDKLDQFNAKKQAAIRATKARAVWACQSVWLTRRGIFENNPKVVGYGLSRKADTSRARAHMLGFSSTSAYPAVLLAEYLGAKTIGLIGVDFGTHPNLRRRIPELNEHFGALRNALEERGVYLVNLSKVSALDCLPVVDSVW